MSKKKKKDKPIYIDDGSTIADMSGVGRKRPFDGAPSRADDKRKSANQKTSRSSYSRRRASFGEQFKTYTQAVKMMFLPMLVVIGIICVVFLVLWLLAGM